jgi:putative DNA primase/helicase
METFISSKNDRHPTELAMLKGARMVCASETEEGRAWAEVRLKTLTGGDVISARFMRQNFFEYLPQFKLCVIGNHKPMLRNVGDAEKRRINMAPFVHKPAVVNPNLDEELKPEWPAILRWGIEGCLDWLKNGLVRPKVVLDSTKDYFDEQDLVNQWAEDCCERAPNYQDTVKTLFKSWSDYAVANGEKPGSSKWFSDALARMGFKREKNVIGAHGQRGFSGIRVKHVDTSQQWQNRADADWGELHEAWNSSP